MLLDPLYLLKTAGFMEHDDTDTGDQENCAEGMRICG
jgi:hypothetical protein